MFTCREANEISVTDAYERSTDKNLLIAPLALKGGSGERVMDQTLELTKAKLARIAQTGDESDMAFVTTLLTCGGKVPKEQGYPWGFS